MGKLSPGCLVDTGWTHQGISLIKEDMSGDEMVHLGNWVLSQHMGMETLTVKYIGLGYSQIKGF